MQLMVPTMRGDKIPLKEIATIRKVTGPAFIYREQHQAVHRSEISIRKRDLGSTIAEARDRVRSIKLPTGIVLDGQGI